MEKVELEKFEELNYEMKESFNSLRTNINFCGPDIKVLLITSSTQDEGKTTVTMDLARTFAEDGKKVLLIDCDLRKSILVGHYHAINEKKKIIGLSSYLTAQGELDEVIYKTDIENFDIIFSGRTVPNPTELLGNSYFESLIDYAKENYDLVLLDSPPLGAVIDAAVIAPLCDGAMLLVEGNKNNYKVLQNVKRQLEVTGVKILGVILNKVRMDASVYYKNYYKKYYGKKKQAE